MSQIGPRTPAILTGQSEDSPNSIAKADLPKKFVYVLAEDFRAVNY